MHAAMSRIVATAVLVIASTFVAPSAYASVTCEPWTKPPVFGPDRIPRTYPYCCQFKDTSGPTTGWYKLARCQNPCGSFANYCIGRTYCNNVARGVNCAVTFPCGSLCSKHVFSQDGVVKPSISGDVCGFGENCGST